MFPRLVLTVFLTLCIGGLGQAQTTSASAPASTFAAVALASQALRALTGGLPLSDITIQANGNCVAASDEEVGT